MVKGIKTKRKIKEKEKRSPDPGHYWPNPGHYWPDPGHFGPDFDSGSGLESAFTDPSPGAALTHGLFGLFTDFFTDFPDLIRTVKICFGVCEEGGAASVKSGLK
jgi:hypothetical protein